MTNRTAETLRRGDLVAIGRGVFQVRNIEPGPPAGFLCSLKARRGSGLALIPFDGGPVQPSPHCGRHESGPHHTTITTKELS